MLKAGIQCNSAVLEIFMKIASPITRFVAITRKNLAMQTIPWKMLCSNKLVH